MDILGNIYNDSKALNYHKKFAMRMFDCIQERQMESAYKKDKWKVNFI